jgi:hypothetical protein
VILELVVEDHDGVIGEGTTDQGAHGGGVTVAAGYCGAIITDFPSTRTPPASSWLCAPGSESL